MTVVTGQLDWNEKDRITLAIEMLASVGFMVAMPEFKENGDPLADQDIVPGFIVGKPWYVNAMLDGRDDHSIFAEERKKN